ncbi:unnamed protein product [Nesidiocoris tenuis]|uniref:Uncharacterized protein n=1 Tax=Nesidiocoris tenuis TaxID=355587 RepID=A0A6H5FZ44_9HEMI|nr:unnamed protein product [Nesidiocoris tenuis]
MEASTSWDKRLSPCWKSCRNSSSTTLLPPSAIAPWQSSWELLQFVKRPRSPCTIITYEGGPKSNGNRAGGERRLEWKRCRNLQGIQKAKKIQNRRCIFQSHMEDMKRMDYRRKLFNNQGGRLVAREPNQKEEVAWRMVYLNSRWERLEAAVSLRKRTSADSDICPDVDQELRGLRKWIKETEKRLNVLKIRHNEEISARELEERSREEECCE